MDLQRDDLVAWIRLYVQGAGARGVVVGLSGGIDSAVVAELAVEALGINKVQGVWMPCDSKPQDAIDAKSVADWLEISWSVVNIKPIFDVARHEIEMTGRFMDRLALANMKARLRMVELYAIDSKSLVIGTGNKSELMVGYCTKYGDGGVDFEPIGQYYKTEVRMLAESMEGFPENILTKAPSAGLWEGQTDQEELGMSYDALDAILKRMEDGRPSTGAEFDRIEAMCQRNAHKIAVPPSFNRSI
jgi:NAD+ synthase